LALPETRPTLFGKITGGDFELYETRKTENGENVNPISEHQLRGSQL